MRIAYLNAYGNGSTGRIVDSLKEECQKNGIETISIYARGNHISSHTSILVFNRIEFLIDGLMTRIFDNHGLNSIYNTKKIILILRKFKPDIIHIHNLHGYWINYKILFNYLKEENIKVVWTLHDCWPFTGHCTHFDFIGCFKWKYSCEKCPQKKEYPASALYDGSKRNYRQKQKLFLGMDNMVIVTPSQWLCSMAQKSFFSGGKIKVIHNGIDLEVFKPTISKKRDMICINSYRTLVLGVAGFWNERKGLSYILEAAKVRKDWMFVIVGNVKDKNIKSEKKENVMFVERTESTKELAEWYTAADVFINPTLEDTYPTTNLEAIACGTAVVTFPTGGSGEIVEETGCGYVTSDRNTNSLINNIEKVLKRGIDKNKFILAKEYLDARNKFFEYINLYKSNELWNNGCDK